MPYVRNRTPPERTNGCVIKSPALFFLLLDLEDEPENALDGGVGVSELADQPPTRENENAVRASTSSSSSEETTIIDIPSRSESPDHGEHLRLRADVDPARELVHQEHVGPPVEPLADDELLLVAAGEGARGLAESVHVEGERAHDLRGAPEPPALAQHGPDATVCMSVSETFVAALRERTSPCDWRSSGAKAIPSASALRTVRGHGRCCP